VTLKNVHGKHRKYLPYVFTEQGVAMLSSVLNSPRAIEMNILIMRAFVAMRGLVAHEAPTLKEFKELRQVLMLHVAHTEKRFDEHTEQINQIIQVLDNLIAKPPVRRRIGFNADKAEGDEK
jgi:phage regulator Rha-like protein